MGTELAKTQPAEIAKPGQLSTEQVDILKNTIARGASDDELSFFLQLCKAKRLDPFSKQIHLVPHRFQRDGQWVTVRTPQTGIDGYRAIAQRTGMLDGHDGPWWCGEDGQWREVWTSSDPPAAAKIVVHRKDAHRPFPGIATYQEYVQTRYDKKQGKHVPNSMWSKMPANQLAKCAEALALRKAFPEELAGIYTDDEAHRADSISAAEPHSPRDNFDYGAADEQARKRAEAEDWAAEVMGDIEAIQDEDTLAAWIHHNGAHMEGLNNAYQTNAYQKLWRRLLNAGKRCGASDRELREMLADAPMIPDAIDVEPEPEDAWRDQPFGHGRKYAQTPVRDMPTDALQWVISHKPDTDAAALAQREIDARRDTGEPDAPDPWGMSEGAEPPQVQWGEGEGQPITDLSADQLARYIDAVEAEMVADPDLEPHLEQLHAEMERRRAAE